MLRIRAADAPLAKRSSAGKRKGNVASNDSDPTQLCSIKLAKCIKKE